MKLFRVALLFLPAAPAALAAGDRPNIVLDRPNIVFILADDLGINDLGCYGRKDQPTPALDRLAAEGMRFTSACCAQPICSPTRAAILTGKAPARLRLTTYLPGRPDACSQLLLHPKITPALPLEEVTIAERLKSAGYATGCIGKWHLGGEGFLPTDQGFDVYHPGEANTKPSEGEGGKGEHDLAAAAEKFIEEHRDHRGGPFFLYLAHNNPHVPLGARADLVEKHREAFNPLYAAMIETLDESVGRVLKKLDALGLASRTLVVFTSDNGGLHVLESPHTPATHNGPFRAGKGFCYEGGLRVPLIMRWPGRVKANTVVDTPVISTDWLPTLLELAGVPAPDGLADLAGANSDGANPAGANPNGATSDGVSLAGLILRDEALAPRPLFWHFPHYTNQGGRPAGAVRDGAWKLVEHYEDGRMELFDLSKDPGETRDLSASEPERVASLRGKLEAWRREVGAQGNAANPAFNPAPWRELYRDLEVSSLPAASTAREAAARLEAWRGTMDAVLLPRKDAPSKVPPGAGAILLAARDAKVHGEKLQYEAAPHKDTLGFWVNAGDWAEWEFEAPHAGRFEVELLQGCGKGSGGAEVEVTVAGQSLAMQVEETGHFQRFIPRTIGVVTLEKPGRHVLSVRAMSKLGAAVMDLRRVTLRAAP